MQSRTARKSHRRWRPALAAVLVCALAANAEEGRDTLQAAIDNPARPASDRERDGGRKPDDTLRFAGIKPGDRIAELLPGRGYYTRLLCKLVGDSGRVYAVSIPPMQGAYTPTPIDTAGCSNVVPITLQALNLPAPELHSDGDDPGWVYEYRAMRLPAESFRVPELLDAIWTSENYHDLHNARFGPPDLSLVNRALFDALKPGGVLIVEDHAARKRSGAADTETLHRIEDVQAIKELIEAGFVLDARSEVLRSADDPHTAKAHELHDRTDRFLLRFRRP